MVHNLFSAHSPKEATLVNLLRYRALEQPNQVPYTFLVDGETEKVSLTYETLDQKARTIAALLQSMKAFGERVLLLYPPGLEFIAAFFGGLYAGVTVVPVYPPRGKQRLTRLQAIAGDAQAKFALTTSSVITKLAQSFDEAERAALQCIATDEIANDLADDWFFPEITNNSLALLQYTSGTTGNPKGVMVNHDNLLYNSALIYQSFEHTPNSRGVIWLPPYHDMGLIGGVLQPIYGSFSVTLMSPESFLQKPFCWLKAISDYQATTSGGPNFAYDLCVEKITLEQRKHLDLSSWEVAFNGAEPVRAETIERFSATFADCGFRRSAFYPCYGMAETTLIVSGGLKTAPPVIRFVEEQALKQNRIVTTTKDTKDARAIVGVGHSSLDQKIAIANPESLTCCSDEEIGEIWVAGQSVTSGYWKKPEETQQTFNAQLQDTKEGSFLRTGDLGFLLDGELFITGRLKDMIIIRGQNHYPQDIELTVQKSHPALRTNCGAVFSVEIKGVEQLVITQEIERTYLRQLDVDEVVKSIRQAVSEQHQLQVYTILLLKTASIPKTSSGKIQRHACRVGFLNETLDVVGNWTANLEQIDLLQLQAEVKDLSEQVQNSDVNQFEDNLKSFKPTVTEKAIQTWLISHLALYLNIPPDEIDIQESFAAYGLDSAVAVSMTGELSQWIGCELGIILFWEYPSIETLAKYLVEEYHLLPSIKSSVSV
ncbi:MAG: AMP-binding protein [Stigonema ocellatum SAG 48.90 = DSM 106950]|nr:AMP-binding protein [Stigonema ocellatum SAG 48.90 = DSM 106950]